MKPNQFSHNEQSKNGSGSQWEGVFEEEQKKEALTEEVSDRDVAFKMMDVIDEQQGGIVEWLNCLNRHQSLSKDGQADYDGFLEEQYLSDNAKSEKLWQTDLEKRLDDLEFRGQCIVSVMDKMEYNSSKNAGKSLEEVFADTAKELQGQIQNLVKSHKWEIMTDEQRDSLVKRRDEMSNLADWAPHVRRTIVSDKEGDGAAERSGNDERARGTKQSGDDDGDTIEAAEEPKKELLMNSDAEVLAVCGALESIRPDVEQLFAVARGSMSLEQMTGMLLAFNRRMSEISAVYANTSAEGKSVGDVQQIARVYEKEMQENLLYSMNAIEEIRGRAVTLPISVKAPMLRACQKIENTLGQVMQVINKKDGKQPQTSKEKERIDNKEMADLHEEEMGM